MDLCNFFECYSLINASDIKSKLGRPTGRADLLAKSKAPSDEKLKELYLAVFSREPTSEELKNAIEYLSEARVDAKGKPLNGQKVAKENFEDVIWALINTKEFIFNH